NDLETSAWSDVELEAHAAMLGIPGHSFALTRAQAKKQKGQGSLDPGTMDQVLPKARASRSKALPTIPPSTVDSTSEEEEFPPCAEPTPEELEADTAELLGEGGPAREELSVAQQTCPTLEGLRQQAVKQTNGDVSDSHRVYWEDNLLYTEARDPKPGTARRLVISQEYRKFLLTLAHDIPLAGHLGQMKTWDRLVPLFHWPRMSEDTKEFCKSCETCQASSKTGGTPKAPLIPLPVVGVPFERVGVDIVAPLDPPTASGNRFILVVVDHATRYPEAIPLRTTTAPAVAKALLGIFSRVGFPKEVVSDRGSNFMSAYLKAMWKECGVTYKFTTPYHPQTNGLVERFNKTLKGMIMGLPEKLRRRWDILLPCLLFAYREVPQKGVGFSPFELLFGHPVRGPLTLVKEGWEQPLKAPKQDIVDDVLGLRSRMAEYMKKASKNLQASQELQKQWHDQKAVLVQYEPGQKVWVLEPVAPRALQDKWSGPHTIVEKKGEVTYLVDLGTARSPLRVLHVNRLKPYYDRADLTLLMATDEGQEEDSDPLPDLFSSTEQDALVEGVVLADCLTAEQKDHCINLLGQFSELFSTVPGTTSWCEHTIDTGDSLPVKSKIYRQPDHVRDCIKQEVQKMLELGVVEHSESPWASPVVLVPKPHSKDGKKEMRFCVDYRGLNQVTKTDAHPIPRADELIDTLASAKYLSPFDLTAGYWQIKLSEDAKPKTAFSTIGGHYQFTVMPFGLKNAPATFQRLVNTVLQGLEAFSAAYLDDIAVFSSSWDDHLVHLWKVLKVLQKAGLTIKASRCQIGQGNDLETSAWSDVELEAHAAMLGIPGHIFALTRAQAKKQKGQGSLDPGTMDQVLPKARVSRSKALPTIPPSTVDSTSEEEEFPPCAEPTPEELEADTAELLGEGGPAREELSVAQQTCPTLEGLRQQAVKQANGDVSDSHRVYWEDNLLYTEARDPKPGTARSLVIPQEYRKFLLTLAHDIPLAGHLGQMKTWDRLVPLFHWPRMSEDTKEFCKSCETCQASGKTGGTPKAPLIPMPVVGVPFERVGFDIVGPLDPPTASGNRFILVVVDHATRYPEAIPLRTTTAPAVAKALLGIFSRVGFPKEVVSDRGSNFMSAYLKAMWKECGVTYKFTTPYHPQTNGLVERFNKTLKGMIMGLPEKLRRRWDILLPCLLFAYREVPQKGVGFSPFELLFGHPVRGPLTLVKEGWEQPLKAPKQDIVDDVLGLRSRMAEYMKKASKNLQASQELQKQWHDQKAVLVQYEPGQKVWVLEPVAPRALQDKWSGPHTIVEKKGEVTYLVDLGTARSPLRVLHVNRLKPYYDRADLTLLMATDEGQEEDSDPLPDLFSSTEQDALVEDVVLADCLTAEQKDHCINLLGQFSELFSTVPGTTSWCEHTIDTGDSLPVKSKIYRQPDHVRDCIKQEVQKMLELGVVEHSESPWASPVVLVPKPHSKDGKKEMRFCVDYRGLNQVTKTDAHPIPRADELIDTLASAKYLSPFDLTAGYWQIKLSEDAKPKTAFSTIGGHYQFTVMPFGLKNAPATFQRLVNTVLQGLEAFSSAYLDDIAVFSSSWDDHLVHLWKVLKVLQKAGLTIKASRCQIGQVQELIRVPLHLSLHLLPRNRLLTALEACKTAT
ncbi:hypothetical protein NDU88_004081, partial [Pleurodeles waltl]